MTERLKKYIGVEEEENPKKKTKIWTIYNKRTQYICGVIKWSGAWRKYVFETGSRPSIYDWDFLRFVAGFCEVETKKQLNKL